MSIGVDPRIGTELGAYRIEALIGRGGMGVVYRAEQRFPRRRVALKVLAPELSHDDGFRERFERECDLAASIEHPNIIPIYEAGVEDGNLFIAMRYVEGVDLKTMIDSQGRLTPEAALRIVGQVANALHAAHQRGLVHRDVKPANILISTPSDESGVEHVYLTDFGVAKQAGSRAGLTKTGFFVGTLDYAAPEQIEGRQLDGRADIYALACVLYQSLCGVLPFEKESEVAVLYAHLTEPPPSICAACPDLPPAFDEVMKKALAKSRDDRYQTTRLFMEAAREALGTTPADRSASAAVLPPAPTVIVPRSRQADTAPEEAGPIEPVPPTSVLGPAAAAAAADATHVSATTGPETAAPAEETAAETGIDVDDSGTTTSAGETGLSTAEEAEPTLVEPPVSEPEEEEEAERTAALGLLGAAGALSAETVVRRGEEPDVGAREELAAAEPAAAPEEEPESAALAAESEGTSVEEAAGATALGGETVLSAAEATEPTLVEPPVSEPEEEAERTAALGLLGAAGALSAETVVRRGSEPEAPTGPESGETVLADRGTVLDVPESTPTVVEGKADVADVPAPPVPPPVAPAPPPVAPAPPRQPRQPPPKRGRLVLFGLLALLVIGIAVGAVLVLGGGDDSTEGGATTQAAAPAESPATTEAAATTEPGATTDSGGATTDSGATTDAGATTDSGAAGPPPLTPAEEKLVAVAKTRPDFADCKALPEGDLAAKATAGVRCGTEGPVKAQYLQFPTAAAMNAYYDGLRPDGITPDQGTCGQTANAENEWIDDQSGATMGRLLCYETSASPRLVWTNDETRVVATAYNADSKSIDSIVPWWESPGVSQAVDPVPTTPDSGSSSSSGGSSGGGSSGGGSSDSICSDPNVDPILKERAGC